MPDSNERKSHIPDFKDLGEAAEFFDTHDLSEFEGDFEKVEVEFARPLVHVIDLELDIESLTKLDELGEASGTNAEGLARIWVLERLQQELARSEEPSNSAPLGHRTKSPKRAAS